MKNFYSILFIKIRPEIEEKVSAGLLLVSDKSVFFDYSAYKINSLKSIISKDALSFAKEYLFSISKNIEKVRLNLNISIQNTDFFSKIDIDNISSLNKYNQNLVHFSKPVEIDIEANQHNFNKLFEMFIAQKPAKKLNNKSTKIRNTQKKLYKTISKNVNIDIQTSEIKYHLKIENIHLLPEKINFVGKNGSIVSGQFFDFNKKYDNLKAEMSYYYNFINQTITNKQNSKFFVLGDEPDKTNHKNHELWEEFINIKNIDNVSLNDTKVIEEFIADNDFKPLINVKK